MARQESPIARSLAFTALLDVSPEFGRTPMAQGSQDITQFIEDHRALVAEHGFKWALDRHAHVRPDVGRRITTSTED